MGIFLTSEPSGIELQNRLNFIKRESQKATNQNQGSKYILVKSCTFRFRYQPTQPWAINTGPHPPFATIDYKGKTALRMGPVILDTPALPLLGYHLNGTHQHPDFAQNNITRTSFWNQAAMDSTLEDLFYPLEGWIIRRLSRRQRKNLDKNRRIEVPISIEGITSKARLTYAGASPECAWPHEDTISIVGKEYAHCFSRLRSRLSKQPLIGGYPTANISELQEVVQKLYEHN